MVPWWIYHRRGLIPSPTYPQLVPVPPGKWLLPRQPIPMMKLKKNQPLNLKKPPFHAYAVVSSQKRPSSVPCSLITVAIKSSVVSKPVSTALFSVAMYWSSGVENHQPRSGSPPGITCGASINVYSHFFFSSLRNPPVFVLTRGVRNNQQHVRKSTWCTWSYITAIL